MALSPPPQPTYVLRGHESAIHAVAFIRANTRLVTGDANGALVVWSLATKRPVAAWRAHDGAILGVAAGATDRLISHGKDNKLIVWKLAAADEPGLTTALPADPAFDANRPPWILHILHVNTMNFCSFHHCPARGVGPPPPDASAEAILVAVPNTLSSETVDIFHLPSETRIDTLPAIPAVKTGMVMAVRIFWHDDRLTVAAGFESGHVSLAVLHQGMWHTQYHSQPHTQPVLSLDVHPLHSYYLTSSADALLVRNACPPPPQSTKQSPTATPSVATPSLPNPSGLSQLLAGSESRSAPSPTPATVDSVLPAKVVNTKHAGQQSLVIRSDGKIFATAGWDARVRVYATDTMKELAVLKWHNDGCYAVDLAEVDPAPAATEPQQSAALVPRTSTVSVREKRLQLARVTHWLAAGSKDGKVSLWDIY